MDNAKDFEGWRPDGIHEVKAKIWEWVDITYVPSILVVGIYCIVNHLTDEGNYTSTTLNDNIDFPVVRSTSFHWPSVIVNTLPDIEMICYCCPES